jgi:hypothetical protein
LNPLKTNFFSFQDEQVCDRRAERRFVKGELQQSRFPEANVGRTVRQEKNGVGQDHGQVGNENFIFIKFIFIPVFMILGNPSSCPDASNIASLFLYFCLLGRQCLLGLSTRLLELDIGTLVKRHQQMLITLISNLIDDSEKI